MRCAALSQNAESSSLAARLYRTKIHDTQRPRKCLQKAAKGDDPKFTWCVATFQNLRVLLGQLRTQTKLPVSPSDSLTLSGDWYRAPSENTRQVDIFGNSMHKCGIHASLGACMWSVEQAIKTHSVDQLSERSCLALFT